MAQSTSEQPKDKLTELLSGLGIENASDEDVKGLIHSITGYEDIETKTNINRQQLTSISRAIWFAKRYGVKPLDDYTRRIMLRLLVSIERGGRNDIRDALSNVFRFNLEKQKNETVKV